MTGQAVGEHLQLLLVVRFTMTIPAVRDLAVLLVTLDAADPTVLARCPLPLAIHIIMTTATGLYQGVAGKTDSQGCVNPHMTGHAVLD